VTRLPEGPASHERIMLFASSCRKSAHPAHSASLRAFTPVFDGLWTRVNALLLAIQDLDAGVGTQSYVLETIGEGPRRHSCARSRSLSSHSLLYPSPYPSPRLARALAAAGAQITAPAIAGSTAASNRRSNASRPFRGSADFARQIRTPARATGEAAPGKSRRAAEHEATGQAKSAQRERGPATARIRVNRSAMWRALRAQPISSSSRSG
jgi:hypothetical protein